MAEVVVSPFLGVFYEKLSSLIGKEFDLLQGVNKDCLETILSTIRLVLRDVGAIQIRDETTRDWLRRLKDTTYDADDILDEWAYESLMIESDVGDKSCNEEMSASISACFDLKEIIIRSLEKKKEMGLENTRRCCRFNGIGLLRSLEYLCLQFGQAAVLD
ncbi:hypothetical protein IFM89_000979 [Coptis chinensis]|uniref:Disease resistance N-terminal domain-containing protein n=1 Tax=Coptis chinensis TaxID=261450 RepID=A0A835IJI8_9MAGN|nr:hypothetical protein IFM89_000979 [Coptis chinensis]